MTGKKYLGLAIALLAVTASMPALTQTPNEAGPQDGPGPGMGPHRPPMERALGFGGGMHGEHGRWWNEPKLVAKLKLTDSQRKSMDDTFQQHRMGLVDLHASLEKLEIAMEPLIKADQPDEGKILAQIDRVAQARAELEKANARMLLDIRRQLTPEQWKQLEADRAARHGGPGEGGPGVDGVRRWHGQPGGGQAGSGQGASGQGGPGGANSDGGPGSPSGPDFE